jgi:hypothetical protein
VRAKPSLWNISSRMNRMKKKVIDLMTYRIEKTLKENGFEVKKDDNKNIKILIKLSNND